MDEILSSAQEETKQNLKSNKTKFDSRKVSWKGIKGSNKFDSKFLDAWGTRDFLSFFLKEFELEVGTEFLIAIATGCDGIKKIQDSLAVSLGRRPDNQITKDYIEWFVRNHVTRLINRYQCFKLRFMFSEISVEEFLDECGIVDRPKKETGAKENIKDYSIFSEKNMETVYMSSPNNFVLRYGLVLSVIWLMQAKSLSESEATRRVAKEASILVTDGKFSELAEATEKHNPYPLWCNFDQLGCFLYDLASDTGELFDIIDISFSDESDRFNFLDNRRE